MSWLARKPLADRLSTMTREAHRPQRTVPLSLLASLAICTALYVLVSLVVTGLADYRALGVPDPILLALEQGAPALIWVRHLVTLVALVGLTSVVLVSLYGQVRIFYAMAEDGLLPASFCRVHPHLRTPHVSTLITGLVAAAAAGLLPLRLLGEAISLGVLLAFVAVCASVLILRRMAPDLPRPFRVPWAPFVPLAGALACAYLMFGLPPDTWLRVAIWAALGASIYVLYGRHRSRLQTARMQKCNS